MIRLDHTFLRGSYPPLITPFLENGEIDYATYERLIDFQVREGSHGIVVNPPHGEILVERVKGERWAERNGDYACRFAMFNGP